MTESVWTDDRIQQLRDMKAVGLSAAKIAACLGSDFTRNAVIGKANRLGIGKQERLAPEQPREKHRPVRPPHVNKPTLAPLIGKKAADYKWGFRPRAEPTVSIPAPVTEHVTLTERTGCAFPVNDGRPFLFCNFQTKDRSNYCEHHSQKMFVGVR